MKSEVKLAPTRPRGERERERENRGNEDLTSKLGMWLAV